MNEPHAARLPPLTAGTIINGKFRVDAKLGRGGMGVVVSATHLELNERVALKFLETKENDSFEDFRARFELEARVCATLRNRHIARVRDVGVWGATPFMVMDLLDGHDLRNILRESPTIELGRAVDYVVQICEGLAEAHARGIVHRDLKPANLFITKDHDGADLVKVLDFGISKWSTEQGVDELTKTGVLLGSPKHMSPEQLDGSRVDSRADIWALGTLLYQMVTGRLPYDGPNTAQTFLAVASGRPPEPPRTFAPDLPEAVEDVILRCLVRDRDRRIQDVAELAGALLDAIESPHALRVRAHVAGILSPQTLRSMSTPSPTTGTHSAFAAQVAPSSVPVPPRHRGRVALVAAAIAGLAIAGSMARANALASFASASASQPAPAHRARLDRAPQIVIEDHAVRTVKPSPLVAVARPRFVAPAPRPTTKPDPLPAVPAVTAHATSAPTPKAPRVVNPLDDRQ